MNTITSEKKLIGSLDLSKEHHEISIIEANILIARYSNLPASVSFPKNVIMNLLNQNYDGIRFYFAQKNNAVAIALVAARKIIGTRYDDVTDGVIALSTSENLIADETAYYVSETDAHIYTNEYRNSDSFTGRKGGLFGRDAFIELLNQNDCTGIRVYFAKDDDGMPTVVIYGVDSNGFVINAYVADRNAPCPNYCSGTGL